MPKNIEQRGRIGQNGDIEANTGSFAGTGNSFAARFGRVILQHGIAALPSALYHFGGKLDLYAQHVWFISYILSHKWDEDLPYPSLGVMSRASGMSKRQLQRYSDELQGMGYLLVLPRRSQERGQESNYYDFAALFERLEACITEHVKSRTNNNPISSVYDPTRAPDFPQRNGHENGYERGIEEIERAQHDPSFVARYGRVLTRYGVAAVPRALFTYSKELDMTPQQVWFVAYIFSYQWDTSLPYPSIVRMALQTGYTAAYLHRIKTGLVERGSLRLVRRTKSDGGQDSNAYDFSPLLDEIRNLLKPSKNGQAPTGDDTEADATAGALQGASTTPPVKKARRGSLAAQARRDRAGAQVRTMGRDGGYAQPSDAQYTPPGDMQYPLPRDAQFIAPGDTQYREGSDTQLMDPNDAEYARPGDAQLLAPVKRKTPRPMTGSAQPPVTRGEHEIEADHPEQNMKDDSSYNSVKKASENEPGEARDPAYSPFISRVVADFSYELGDADHVLENVGQAMRLWRTSGLQAEAFVDLMYTAKRTTREGQGKHGAMGLTNKMAYFFACLRRSVPKVT
jgi:hypothetical protein